MKIVCIGNSHVGAFSAAAFADWDTKQPRSFDLYVGRLGHPEYIPVIGETGRLNPVLASDLKNVHEGLASSRIHFVGSGTNNNSNRAVLLSMVGGNAHNLLGLVQPDYPFDFFMEEHPELPVNFDRDILPQGQVAAILDQAVQNELLPILKALKSTVGMETWHLESPPPIRSNDHIAKHLEERFKKSGNSPVVSPSSFRFKLWRLHSTAVRKVCQSIGVRFIPYPISAVDEEGFLLPSHVPNNATHAAVSYGKLQLDQLEDLLSTSTPYDFDDTPYRNSPDTAFWSRAVAGIPSQQVDPGKKASFLITKNDKVATAGSCFAQHIARHLAKSGYNYYVAEQPHPALGKALANDFGYGVFSARYANIYTSRQLLQLIQRAEGQFAPSTIAWEAPNGSGVVDPFRPTIHPGNYSSVEEMLVDRDIHLSAVRRMLREMDVFIFTLGLTETWVDRRDGAAFPLCPGINGGKFDPGVHQFINLSVDDVRNDLSEVISILRIIRPSLKVILTVSPVPLKATASSNHVLTATTYSKSVLRVAAHDIVSIYDNVEYFPSYEIITGNFNRGCYYAADLREVLPEGVSHVMRSFFDHMTDNRNQVTNTGHLVDNSHVNIPAATDQEITRLECEEELLDFDRIANERKGK